MTSRADIYAAIKNADAAGDTESVKKLAGYLQSMPSIDMSPAAHDARVATQQAQDAQAYNPTNDMGVVAKTVAGYGSAVPRLFRGVGQRLAEAVDAVVPSSHGLSDLITGGKGKTFSSVLGLPQQSDVDEANRLDAPLLATKAGSVGNVAGNVAAAIPTVFIPGAATLGGSAVIGATLGATTPTSTGESALRNVAVGAAAGPAGVIGGRVLGAVAGGGKALVEPFYEAGRQRIAGRMLQRFAEDPSKIAGATSAPTATGALPTLAEQTGDRGLAQLQDSLRSVDPQIANQIEARLSQNNAARVGALQDLAGTDATRLAATDARTAATRPLYQQATNAAYTVDPQLEGLLQRPAVQQALTRAQTLAKNQGRTFSFNVEPTNSYSGLGIPNNNSRQITGQSLQDLKMAMDEMLTDPASGFTGKAGSTVKDLRGQLLNWMEGANPEFKAARTQFADLSRPLNQQDTAAELLKRGTSATSNLNGDPRLMTNGLLRAMRDEPGIVSAGTGRQGLGDFSQVFEPNQLNMLRTIANESDRAGAVASAGNGPGSATAQRMASQNILRQLVGPTGLPSSWAESVLANTIVGKPFNLLYGGVAEPKIQQALAQAVLDPGTAQAMLQSAAPAQQNALMSLLARSSAARAVPTAENMSRR